MITLPDDPVPSDLTTASVAPWLHFASQRLAGELWLDLPGGRHQEEELELPLLERVTRIHFNTENILRLPAAGSFAALETVSITYARMEGRDLECFGSSRCPRLRKLYLCQVLLVTASDVAIRSESLEVLFASVNNTRRLEVVAPMLQLLRAPLIARHPTDLVPAHIVALELANIGWYQTYDPRHHQFVGSRRHIRKLVILNMSMAALMQRFNTVNELFVSIDISNGRHGYVTFLRPPYKLGKCETMDVYLNARQHAYAPSMLHVLRKSTGVRKLVVLLPRMTNGSKHDKCTSSACPCFPEGYATDNFALDSLEEVVSKDFRGLPHHIEFLTVLLECNAANRKNVTIHIWADAPSVSEDAFQEIHSFARLNINVKLNVWPRVGTN